MDTRFLDDLTPGQTFITPGFTLTESEIIDFAWRYDPQAFHLDANAAAESPYGGLIASGFQSLAIVKSGQTGIKRGIRRVAPATLVQCGQAQRIGVGRADHAQSYDLDSLIFKGMAVFGPVHGIVGAGHGLGGGGFDLRQLFLERADFGHQLRGAGLVLGGLGSANRLGGIIAPGQPVLGAGLQFA